MKNTLIAVLTLILVMGVGFLVVNHNKQLAEHAALPPSSEAKLAQCLSDKGFKFYGAYWCPHCHAQKAAFADGADKLPYVECAQVGGDQTQICIDKKITGYPTWITPTGEILNGEQKLPVLSQKSGCPYTPSPSNTDPLALGIDVPRPASASPAPAGESPTAPATPSATAPVAK